jgi:hypothetical protein
MCTRAVSLSALILWNMVSALARRSGSLNGTHESHVDP